jgi:hypothetical protein
MDQQSSEKNESTKQLNSCYLKTSRRSGGMDWIDLVWDRERWQALVNAVINLQVP